MACSLCRVEGHNRSTCPFAQEIYAERHREHEAWVAAQAAEKAARAAAKGNCERITSELRAERLGKERRARRRAIVLWSVLVAVSALWGWIMLR